MPAEERDQQFEQALERRLRSGSPEAACPDAETLAAYYERTLSLEEMARWKEHIAGCARCQETLALLEESSAVALDEWEEKDAVARPGGLAHLPVAQAGSPDGDAMVETSVRSIAAGSAAFPGPVMRDRRQGSKWKWIVPAGALAAGLLIFVGVRERQEQKTASLGRPPVEVAENRTPQAAAAPEPQSGSAGRPAPAAKSLSTEVQRDDPLTKKQNQTSYDGAVRPRVEGKRADDEELAKLKAELDAQERGLRMPGAPLPSPPRQPLRTPAPARSSSEFSALNRAPTLAAKAKSVPEYKTLPTETAAGAQVADATSQVEERDYVPMRERIAADRSYILDPGGKALWRVGAAGKVELSADFGKSWSAQASGTKSDLTTGAAVSDKVCWIVGKAGTLLVTGDGGAHWKQVVAPVAEDLATVRATDAEHAIVGTAASARRFTTSDGGLSWTLVPGP